VWPRIPAASFTAASAAFTTRPSCAARMAGRAVTRRRAGREGRHGATNLAAGCAAGCGGRADTRRRHGAFARMRPPPRSSRPPRSSSPPRDHALHGRGDLVRAGGALPAVRRGPRRRLAALRGAHGRRTTVVVAGPMLVELATGAALVVHRPAWLLRARRGAGWPCSRWLAVHLAAQVPRHAALAQSWDAGAHRALVRTNWVRTAAGRPAPRSSDRAGRPARLTSRSPAPRTAGPRARPAERRLPSPAARPSCGRPVSRFLRDPAMLRYSPPACSPATSPVAWRASSPTRSCRTVAIAPWATASTVVMRTGRGRHARHRRARPRRLPERKRGLLG
jgi:hypothetical protein